MAGFAHARDDNAPRRCHAKTAGGREIIAESRTHSLYSPGLYFERLAGEVQQFLVA
jgi:hypothetical protein